MPWLCACILQLVSVSVPLLSPSAALWCPNGAGITTGDHKQQLCPVRPHRAAYQHTDLIKTHSQVTECSRGRGTKWWKQPECVLYTCRHAVIHRGGDVSPSRLKSLYKHGVDWKLNISVLRGWILIIHQQVSFHRPSGTSSYLPGFGCVSDIRDNQVTHPVFFINCHQQQIDVLSQDQQLMDEFFMKCFSPLRMNCNNRCDTPAVQLHQHENIIVQLQVQLDGAASLPHNRFTVVSSNGTLLTNTRISQ